MFEWTKEPEAEWEAQVAQLAPPSDQVPWLKLVWEPGDTWAPVQRWELREMYPDLALVPDVVLDACRGPNPRTLGHWSHAERRWIGDSPISRMQWQLFQDTGCYAVRFWIIQGHEGGHPYRLGEAEQRFLALLGRAETDTPRPGQLPYAAPDERTWAKVAEYDKLRHWQYSTDWLTRTRRTAAGLWVQNERLDQERDYGERMLRFLDTVIEGAIDEVPRSRLPAPSDWTATPDTTNREDIEEELLTAISTPRPEKE